MGTGGVADADLVRAIRWHIEEQKCILAEIRSAVVVTVIERELREPVRWERRAGRMYLDFVHRAALAVVRWCCAKETRADRRPDRTGSHRPGSSEARGSA